MKKELTWVLIIFLTFTFELIAQNTKAGTKTKGKVNGAQQKAPEVSIPKLKIKKIDPDLVEVEMKDAKAGFALLLSKDSSFPKRIHLKKEKAITEDTIALSPADMIPKLGWLIGTTFSKKKPSFFITKLEQQTDYFFGMYRIEKDSAAFVVKYSFNTLAPKPSQQASQITFPKVTDSSITVKFLKGNGEGRILVGTKGNKIDFPENGKVYRTSNKFGSTEAQLGNSFVLYDGSDRIPELKIEKLEPGKEYTFAVFEYNGNGKYRNYNLDSFTNNPRSKYTQLNPPEIIEIQEISPGNFLVKWKKVPSAKTYILDLATDKDFNDKLEPYNQADIGDIDTYELSDLEAGNTYYLRLKAIGRGTESNYSLPVEIKVK